jgi:hypothetical protein
MLAIGPVLFAREMAEVALAMEGRVWKSRRGRLEVL